MLPLCYLDLSFLFFFLILFLFVHIYLLGQVEHVIREQNIWAAYEILELFCEFVLARVPVLDSQK